MERYALHNYLPDMFSNESLLFALYFFLQALLLVLSKLVVVITGSRESGRKVSHVLYGILLLSMPFMFYSLLYPLILLLATFLLCLFIENSNKLRLMEVDSRKTFGTIIFPLALMVLFILYWDRPEVIVIGLSMITFADPIAATVGKSCAKPIKIQLLSEEKSLQGGIAMFMSSMIIVACCTVFFSMLQVIEISSFTLLPLLAFSVYVSLFATISEMASVSGSDNLTVPLMSALIYDFYLTSTLNGNITEVWLIFLSLLLLNYFFYRMKYLTLSGAIAFSYGTILIFNIGYWEWFFPAILAFVFLSIISKIGKEKKQKLLTMIKGSTRDMRQILTNTYVGILCSICYFYYPNEICYAIFLASIATVVTDTSASEIGFFSTKTFHLLTLQPMPNNRSGGVSLLGLVGLLLGACLFSIGIYVMTSNLLLSCIVFLSGIAGCFIDSILGCTLQGKYSCVHCNAYTEKKNHCDQPSRLISGYKTIDNDLVNCLSTLGGGVIAALLWILCS